MHNCNLYFYLGWNPRQINQFRDSRRHRTEKTRRRDGHFRVTMDNAIVVLRTWQRKCRTEFLMIVLLCFASVDRGSAFCALQRAVCVEFNKGVKMWEEWRKSVPGRQKESETERDKERRREGEKERRREGEKERRRQRKRERERLRESKREKARKRQRETYRK